MAVVQRCLGGPAGRDADPELDRNHLPGDAVLAGSLRQAGDHAFKVETVKRIRHGATIYFAQSRDKLGYRAHWLFMSHQ